VDWTADGNAFSIPHYCKIHPYEGGREREGGGERERERERGSGREREREREREEVCV